MLFQSFQERVLQNVWLINVNKNKIIRVYYFAISQQIMNLYLECNGLYVDQLPSRCTEVLFEKYASILLLFRLTICFLVEN